jgi:hypothetical protein
MTAAARCPVCGGQMPDQDRSRGGRKARYCSAACKAKAYRTRQQAGGPAAPDRPPLPEGARHARAVEIRQQASDLIAALADTASGQQALFAPQAPARRTRPAETARILHRLIAELATLATTAAVTKRATKRRPPAASLPFGDEESDDERRDQIARFAPAGRGHSDSSDT